ncbi:MAG: protein kinase, partial [Planctomycetaceae bacterium]
MKHELSNARRELAVFSLAQIDAICEEFESEWSPVGSSEFNRYLGQVSDVALPTLFRNLLQIEMRRRKTAGQEPKQEEYLSRYPQHSDLIKEEFEIHKSTIAVSMVEDTAIGDQPTRRKHRLPKVSRLGDYLLGRELGRGAMGIVFAARHVRRGNEVALKTLPTVGGDELQRFKQEFRSLTNINHPNLVGLHTLQVDGGQWFFTMDVVQGEEFLACVRPQGKLDLTRLRDAFSQLVIGVNALHSKNILHRDLKPSNVMVSHEGQVRLLDFGLIVDLSAFGSSTESQIAGTPTYMAPEQFLGQTTAASDWYAVGVMLYQALTGNLPFRGPVNELFRDKQNNDPPPLPADVPEDFRNLCRKLLSRHPQDRPDVTTIFRIACPDTGESAAVLIDNGPADQLLGRDKHVAQIQETIRSFDEHQGPQTLFISGKSGEGKTVLAEYFLKRFREAPTLIVLSGRCYDRESVPFKAIDTLIDALCVRLLEMSDEQVRQLLTPDVAILTELFPVLTRVRAIAQLEKVNIEHVELDRVRRLAGNALRELLSRFGRNLTLVCFVDDLQWGDADSAELLLNVLRPPAGPNILLIGTYRSDEAESSRFLQAWKSATEQLEQQIPHTECEVSPLTPAECVQLVVETVGVDNETVRAHAAAIAEEAAGNPLILSELASYYDPEDRSSQPLHIEDILDRKLGLLPPDARALLEIVSVSGQALSLYEASHSVGHSTVPFSTITRMRSERLVRLVGDEHEPTVDTYHDRIRELVLRDMDAADRQGLHVKLAEVIEASVENVSNPDQSNDQAHPRVYDLAYHFYEGGHSKAFGYQQEAGEAAMRAYALENAIDHFNKAEQIKPDDAD